MSVRENARWMEMLPLLRLEVYGRDGDGRIRIEVQKGVTRAEKGLLTSARTRCAKCGNTIHPFRERKGYRDSLYYASTCQLEDRVACARSAEAIAEYAMVAQDVRRFIDDGNPPGGQLGLVWDTDA